jgi:hypothetical protein
VRGARGQKEDLALLYMNVPWLPIIYDLDRNVAFNLVEELFTLIVVIVFAVVGSAHHHNDELRVLVHLSVADRGLEQMAVFVDPGMEIEGAFDRHTELTQSMG